MPSDAVALVDVSSEPVTLTIGEQTFAVSPLGPGDYAKAEAYMRDQRMNAFLRQTQNVPMTDDARGIALGKIACEPVLLSDLLLSFDSRVHMLWLSLKKRTPSMTHDKVRGLTGVTVEILTTLMRAVTGPHKGKDEGGEGAPNVPFQTSEAGAEVSTPPSDTTTGPTN